MRRLFVLIGFGWTIRVVGFIWVGYLVIANILIRPRIGPSKSLDTKVIDISALKDIRFAFLGAGIFFSELAIFGPITYFARYALARGINTNMSYYTIAFLNVGSCLGRIVPGILADKIGP
jgi:hypothetical protein